jgi:sigma-B regulation protein RsbU (phosphoserine phosphatase)
MPSDTPERWRPDAPFFLRTGAIVFGIGVVIALLVQLGGGELRPLDLALSGFASVLVFLGVCGALVLGLHRIHDLTGLRKAAALGAIFFVAGASSWFVVQGLITALGMGAFPGRSQIITGIWLSGLLAILLGTVFYLYEAMRQRALESASRLKEAEFAEKELALARSIQERLLPPTELSGEGYRIAARHLPARFVAGDFFDIFSLPDGALGLVVADVAGKGVGASLVMASFKAMLPLLASGRTVEQTLVALNEKLCDELDRRQFVALAYARYRPETGDLLLANAGLPDPYLLRPDTQPEPLTVEGPRMPLGLRRNQAYLATRAALADGDGLLLFSDGLPEALGPNGEPFGYEALAELLPPLEPEPGPWLDELFARLRRVTAPDLTDDWTALMLERHS